MNEDELLRRFRPTSGPRDPEALAEQRAALVRHIRGARPAAPRPAVRRRLSPNVLALGVAAAVFTVVVVLVAGIGLVGPGGSDRSPATGGTGPGTGALPGDVGPLLGSTAFAGRPCAPEDPLAAAGGRDLWVSPEGDDARSGRSAAEALRDPQTAVDRAGPGDRVLLMSGTYSAARPAVVHVERSGAPGREIVLTAAPGAEPVLRTTGANWHAVLVSGSFVTVSGLVAQGHRQETDLAQALRQADVRDDPRTAGNGIGVTPGRAGEPRPEEVTVRRTVVRDFPGAGIYTRETGSVLIECNVVSDNAELSPWANSGITVTASATGPAAEVEIRRNVVHDNRSSVPQPATGDIGGGDGIFCAVDGEGWAGSVVVAGNVVHGNSGSGVVLSRCQRAVVAHNTVVGNRLETGTARAEIALSGVSEAEVVDNVIANDVGRAATALPPTAVTEGNATDVDLGAFADAAAGDYRLRCGHPLVDSAGAGDGGAGPDLLGNPRDLGDGPDPGAVESC